MVCLLSGCFGRFGQSVGEGLLGRSAVHVSALVWPSGVVGDHIGIERGLHLVDGLEPGAPSFDAEMLVEQGAVQALDDAVIRYVIRGA